MSYGDNVSIDRTVHIEHPEIMELGDNVTIMNGVRITGKPGRFSIGSDVTIYPNCTILGSPDRIIIGDHVELFNNTFIEGGEWLNSFIEIGNMTHFAPNCILYGWGGLRIGNYCGIASGVVISTVRHHTSMLDKPMVIYMEKAEPITIEDDVWLAANAVVNCGVVIRKGCVIGANSVVLEDTEEFGFYAGVPARLKHTRRY